jgi:hypothetical protein
VLDVKIAALQEHHSQLHDWDPSEMMREWAGENAAAHGMQYAESYRVMILKEEEKNKEA